MAMRAEARPLIDELAAVERELPVAVGPLPLRWYDARVGGLTVVVAVNGVNRRFGVDEISTLPAALNAYVTALHRRPDLLISAGTAGGWAERGAAVGDVFVSHEHLVFHDRRIPLAGFEEYGVGSYPAVDARGMARSLGLKKGIVTTGDSLDHSAQDEQRMRHLGADAKEMEAAAVAWIAEQLSIPVMAVKAITDLVDAAVPTGEQFVQNLARASEALCDAVVRVLEYCEGRTIGDLA